MLKYTHTVYQLLSSCQQLLNYSRVILRIHHAQVHPYSLSAAQQLPAAAQLQQSNSQNQLCTITSTQFISCLAAVQQLLNYSRVILRNNYVQLQQSNSQNPSCSSTPIQFISCSVASSSCSISAEKFSESIMHNHAHTVYKLLSSCTAE